MNSAWSGRSGGAWRPWLASVGASLAPAALHLSAVGHPAGLPGLLLSAGVMASATTQWFADITDSGQRLVAEVDEDLEDEDLAVITAVLEEVEAELARPVPLQPQLVTPSGLSFWEELEASELISLPSARGTPSTRTSTSVRVPGGREARGRSVDRGAGGVSGDARVGAGGFRGSGGTRGSGGSRGAGLPTVPIASLTEEQLAALVSFADEGAVPAAVGEAARAVVGESASRPAADGVGSDGRARAAAPRRPQRSSGPHVAAGPLQMPAPPESSGQSGPPAPPGPRREVAASPPRWWGGPPDRRGDDRWHGRSGSLIARRPPPARTPVIPDRDPRRWRH